MPEVSEYGSWKSPISPELLTSARPSFDFISHSNGNLYWLESRPWENGRSVVVEKDGEGNIRDVLPSPLNARSRVHEYGGTPYLVVDNTLYFCFYDDQRIYTLDIFEAQSIPKPITADNACRYADFCYDQKHHRLIFVCEDHSDTTQKPENFIAAIALDGSGIVSKLVSGDDFYAYPRLNPNNNQLCWIRWNHPNMPWDSTELLLADLDAKGNLEPPILISGGEEESVFQPQWSPQGELYYVSDRNNWWNLYQHQPQQNSPRSVFTTDAEFATPLWVLGMSTYGFCADGTLVCSYTKNGSWQLAKITSDEKFTPIETPYTAISALYCSGQMAWFVGASSTTEAELVGYNLNSQKVSCERSPEPLPFRDNYLSQPQALSFATGGDEIAHGFYYLPTNPNFVAPPNEKPPLLVICHGGPTGATSTALNLKIQFWTSRGFTVLDVNYRGSTGYGRRYREKLNTLWGIADVEDAVCGARHLIGEGLVDAEKLAIRGSSAGGYTVLAALTFQNTFKAGACLYGIGDLETLATDTHKFESRYLDKLIGPYPEQLDLYQQRSPIHHTEQLNCPVIFFQGLDDKVVPPEQAISMVKALRDKKLPVAYLPFVGEGHGFRKAATICQALEAELYFYSKIFDFELADSVTPITIDNL